MKEFNYAIADQFLVSGGNFLISIILGRLLTPSEFGLYIFSFTTLFLALGFVNNLTFCGMSVLGSSVHGKEWNRILHNSLLFFLTSSLALTLLCFIAAYLLCKIGFSDNGNTLTATAIILTFFIGQEFVRRILLTRLKSLIAFISDCIIYIMRIALIYLLITLDRDYANARMAIYIIGLTSLLGIIIGYYMGGFISIKERFKIDKKTIMALWSYSKWIIAEWFPLMLGGSLYIYVVTFVLGNVQTGILGACRNLIQPITILLLSISNIALPFYSKMFTSQGGQKVIKHLFKLFAILFILISIYLITINVFASVMLSMLFGKYIGYSHVVLLFTVATLFVFFFKPGEIYLKISLKPHIVFKSRMYSAIVSLITIFPLIYFYGLEGSLYNCIITEMTMCIAIYVYLYKQIKQDEGHKICLT